ncbi:MAG: peroxiredoxin family protein [Dehalococcoidia bacterium]
MPTIESSIAVGDRFPEIELIDQSRSLRRLPQDRPTVVVFYRGQWCPFCRWELTGLQTIARAAGELGAEIVGISPDTPEESAALIERLSLSYSILSDADLAITDRFGLRHPGGRASTGQDMPFPTTFIVDPLGIVRARIENDTYRDRPNPKDVLAALEQIVRD